MRKGNLRRKKCKINNVFESLFDNYAKKCVILKRKKPITHL